MRKALHLTLQALVLFIVQVATNGLQHMIDSSMTKVNAKLNAEEKKAILLNNIKNMIVDNSQSSQQVHSRALAEGDWEFLNDFFGSIGEVETYVDETFTFSNIDFHIGTIVCDSFGISDIVATRSGGSTQQDLSFHVTGITVQCEMDYSYEGGWLVGSGEDVLSIVISPDTNIRTILSFESEDFESSPPSSSILTCLPQIEIEDIAFDNNRFLDLLVAPFLPNTLEPLLEPTICEPLQDIETMLSDAVLNISNVLEFANGQVPTEYLDKLLPENQIFGDASMPVYVDFMYMQPMVDVMKPLIEGMVSFISSFLGDEEGILRIPINLADETSGLALNEIRISGLNNYTFDPLSLLGNFTFSTNYNIPYIGFEIDLGVKNENNSTDAVTVKGGVHDVNFDFALLLVIEQAMMDAFRVVEPIVEAIANFNMTDLVSAATEISDFIANFNTTEFEDFLLGLNTDEIVEITDLLNYVPDVIAFLVEKIDFSAFDGLLGFLGNIIARLEQIDINAIIDHILSSIYAVEIASFSLTSGGFDPLEITGLTQFIGPQKLFNKVSETVFYMYEDTLINSVDYFLNFMTRNLVNDMIKESFVYDSCLDQFKDSTVYVPTELACLKLELYEGGEIASDSSNPDCSSGIYLGEHISYYSHSSENEAYFGLLSSSNAVQVDFVEDFSVPSLQVVTAKEGDTTIMSLTYPSCTRPLEIVDMTLAPTATPTPMNCNDSPLRFRTRWNGRAMSRDCSWVGNKATNQRCALPGVSAICSDTCGTCSTCADSTNRMKMRWQGRKISRDCKWIANKATNQRCTTIDGVADACRSTCGLC